MAASSYQMERILNRLRRLHGSARRALFWKISGIRSFQEERVVLSEESILHYSGQEALIDEGPYDYETWPMDLADFTPHPAAVEYELERRAGSFMRPKYPPYPPPSDIPKMKR